MQVGDLLDVVQDRSVVRGSLPRSHVCRNHAAHPADFFLSDLERFHVPLHHRLSPFCFNQGQAAAAILGADCYPPDYRRSNSEATHSAPYRRLFKSDFPRSYLLS
ncbi:hypothetical protein Dimus_018173 [Dionaea muscipula]